MSLTSWPTRIIHEWLQDMPLSCYKSQHAHFQLNMSSAARVGRHNKEATSQA
jgi:hypothetical protein